MRRAGSVLFWAFIVVTSILLFPFAVLIWAVTAPFDRRRVALHRFTCFWASLYTWCNPGWPVSITGRDNIEAGQTYMLVANHESLVDILVLFRLFKDYKWVSKIENFKVPVIGWNMRMNRYIPLRRGDRESVIEMMAACRERIGEGSSIMMFPEGTRSTTGQMRPFKTGAFELAREAGIPVVPIVLRGTRNALPKRGFVLQGRHAITVTVLPPVPAGEVSALTAEELTTHVQALIADELASKPTPEVSS
ncbi:MAG: 1-acyl-sn-glycerol-3-phosphate acyltransferase [Actinomycetota bacterium]|nr:1-acyl-sn-glycerol-3-phosphate acyltransferase [Actinomycetota bacterium]